MEAGWEQGWCVSKQAFSDPWPERRVWTECQHQGDRVAVLPRLELAEGDVVGAHASAKSYAAQATKEAGWTVARAERIKQIRVRKDAPDLAAFPVLQLVVETWG